MEIRSYFWNGGNWEHDQCAWESARFSTAGNFRAYKDGDDIKLCGFDDDGLLVAERVGRVRDGKFSER